jgi:hypothetical protein
VISPSASLRLVVPNDEFPYPDALEPLERFSDAGIQVLKNTEKGTIPIEDSLSVSDTLRLHRRRVTHERVASVLKDSDKHLCIFGNLSSAKNMGGAGSDGNQDQHTYLVTELLTNPPEGLRVLCGDPDDLWALKGVLFASGVDEAGPMVDALDIQMLSTFSCKGEKDACADVLLGELHPTRGATVLEPTIFVSTISQYHPVWNLLKDVDIVWYGYEALDVKKLKVVLPFCMVKAVDVSFTLLPKVRGRRKIYTVVSFHSVVYGGLEAQNNRLTYTMCTALVRGDLDRVIDITASNNFLTIYFPFFDASLRVMSTINDEIYRKRYANPSATLLSVGRPRFHILEQFVNVQSDTNSERNQRRQHLAINLGGGENLRGYHAVSSNGRLYRLGVKPYDKAQEDSSYLLRYRGPPTVDGEEGENGEGDGTYYLRGVPLRLWDRVTLLGQERKVENGSYFVVDLFSGGRGIVLQDKLAIRYNPSANDKKTTFSRLEGNGRHTTITIIADLHSHPKLGSASFGDKVYVIGAVKKNNNGKNKVGTITSVSRDVVNIVLNTMESVFEDGKTHPLYICTTDPTIQVKEQCDEEGEVWDRPCTEDIDCPYFQANKNYPNYRGGCRPSGHCEMPLGVRKAGFRRLYPLESQTEVCHNCVDPFQPGGCCADQEKKTSQKYRGLLSPDYAFELDEFERRKQARPGWTP